MSSKKTFKFNKKVNQLEKVLILIKTEKMNMKELATRMYGTGGDMWMKRFKVNNLLTTLRKKGYRVFPSKGMNSPITIAESAGQLKKYDDWQRAYHMGEIISTIKNAFETGKLIPELRNLGSELIEQIKQIPYEVPKLTAGKNKTRPRTTSKVS